MFIFEPLKVSLVLTLALSFQSLSGLSGDVISSNRCEYMNRDRLKIWCSIISTNNEMKTGFKYIIYDALQCFTPDENWDHFADDSYILNELKPNDLIKRWMIQRKILSSKQNKNIPWKGYNSWKLDSNKTLLSIKNCSKIANRISKRSYGPEKTKSKIISGDIPMHKRTSVQYSSLVGPSFVHSSLHNKARAQFGQTARLYCVVKNLHNYTLSWIRASDINLLTLNDAVYSSDKRFAVSSSSKGSHWVLTIHHVKFLDSGKYICQISTSPPISKSVTLFVTEPKVSVEPSSVVFLKVGSPVKLVCIVEGCPPPAQPSWYKDKMLQNDLNIEEYIRLVIPSNSSSSLHSNLTENATAIYDQKLLSSTTILTSHSLLLHNVLTDLNEVQGSNQEISSNKMASHKAQYTHRKSEEMKDKNFMKEILIAKATFQRPRATMELSGVYTCTTTCTAPVYLTLHVLVEDEDKAAMQRLNGAHLVKVHLFSMVLTSMILALPVHFHL